MKFKFKLKDNLKFIGNDYLNLKEKTLIVTQCFSLNHLPTYEVHVKDEEWKKYFLYESSLKLIKRENNG